MAAGLRANVWYTMHGEVWRETNLLAEDRSALPAYAAYAFMSREISGARYVSEVSGLDGLVVHEFERGMTKIWIAWSRDGAGHLITLPQAPQAIFDLYGNPISSGDALTIGSAPVYFEFTAEVP